MPESHGDVKRLLGQLRAGNQDVAGQLVPLIYDELRRIAHAQMAREVLGHTLQATAVLNEAYMRLVGEEETPWQNRALRDRRTNDAPGFAGLCAPASRRAARRRGRSESGP